PKMKGFIFGFQRFVWCPKWTPASSRSFNAIPFNCPPMKLAFAELEALARALLSVLLALLDPRIARQEAFFLQLRPELHVVLHERARDAEAQRAGLAGDPAAGDRREDVELLARFGDGQRTLDLGAKSFGGEGLLDGFAVDRHDARAGPEKHASRRCLATPG